MYAYVHVCLNQCVCPFSRPLQVKVISGDMLNLIGVVTAVVGSQITVQPSIGGLGTMEFKAMELRKFFKLGDHVKVTNGTRIECNFSHSGWMNRWMDGWMDVRARVRACVVACVWVTISLC